MFKAVCLSLSLFMPFQAVAWEDDMVLSFIRQVNPIILAQRNVSQAYAKPNSVTWALQNRSLSGRLGLGGADFRNAPYTVFGGLQISIPLSSIKEDREQALKLVAEAKETEDMHTKVIMDIAQLRTLEAELAASEVRQFLKVNGRIKQRLRESINIAAGTLPCQLVGIVFCVVISYHYPPVR